MWECNGGAIKKGETMEFRKQKSIYQQIADRLMEQIAEGTPAADDRMPSVRDVAASIEPHGLLKEKGE